MTECPVCGGLVTAEYVDIGVGQQRVTPFYCTKCDWEEGCEIIEVDEDKEN